MKVGYRSLAVMGALWLALALLLLPVATAHAENLGPGGGTRVQVGDQVVGPYRLLVTTSPDPAQTGLFTVVIRATDPGSKAVLKDLTASVEMVNAETDAVIQHAATHKDAGNPVDYVAHVQVDQAGSWRITVHVDGPAGAAQTSFDQRILAPRQGSTLLAVGLPFLVILGALGGFWYFRSGSRPRVAGQSADL